MLVQIFIIFYGFTWSWHPNLSLSNRELLRSPLTLVLMRRNGEGLHSLRFPKGQWEASYAIGMNYTQAFVRTIMPQALRISVPSLSTHSLAQWRYVSGITRLDRWIISCGAKHHGWKLRIYFNFISEAVSHLLGILFCAVNGTNPFRKTPFSPFIRTGYVKSHEYSEKF